MQWCWTWQAISSLCWNSILDELFSSSPVLNGWFLQWQGRYVGVIYFTVYWSCETCRSCLYVHVMTSCTRAINFVKQMTPIHLHCHCRNEPFNIGDYEKSSSRIEFQHREDIACQVQHHCIVNILTFYIPLSNL